MYNDISEKVLKIKRFVFTDEILSGDIPLRYKFISWNQGHDIYIQMEIVLTDLTYETIFKKCISKLKRSGKQCKYIMDKDGFLGVRLFYYY